MTTVGRKQQSRHEDWLAALQEKRADPASPDRAEKLVDTAAREIRRRLPALGNRPAYCWSGGKDSLVLELACERAGISECMIAITDLEYPAFLAWAGANMPAGLAVESRRWDLEWLASHQDMLFPATAAIAARWMAGVQHWGQRRYAVRRNINPLILGRRRGDGNWVGRNGADLYQDRAGFTRWSPLADWTNDDVLTVLAGFSVDLPPCYSWPRGFRVGTGSWPFRQWCTSTAHGWAEVAQIDPSVVAEASALIPSAAAYLEGA